jgi:hypothetical protein
MPKVKEKKKSKIAKATAKLDKLETFVDALDLQSMWEDFCNTFNDNGTQTYKTIWAYISKFTKDAKHRDILYWMLGPAVDIKPGEVGKYKLDQYDWETKRKNGYWYEDSNIKELQAQIHHKASAYDSIREAGKVNVGTITMLHKLLQQLEDEFGGRLFLPKLSMKENAFRATLYMQLLERITNISRDAQLMYAKTQGLDLNQLDAFFQMFGNQMGKTANMLMGQKAELEDVGDNHLKKTFGQAISMVMSKAQEFDMPLPDDLAAAIKETQEPKKKAKVN